MIVHRNQPESWKQWKNGGGLTREIAVYPASASSEDFLWRVSTAKIEHPGPFSRFCNVHRRLMLLNGNGLLFQFADRANTLVDIGQSIDFSGDEDLYCSPLDGACLVLNVMTRGDQVCEMYVANNASISTTRDAERLIFVAEGAIELIEDSAPPALLQTGDAAFVLPHAQLQVEGAGGMRPILVELVFCPSSARLDEVHA